MVETTNLDRQVEEFIIKEFGFKKAELSDDEKEIFPEHELIFVAGNKYNDEIIRKKLLENFNGINFHTTIIGGMLAVLVEV